MKYLSRLAERLDAKYNSHLREPLAYTVYHNGQVIETGTIARTR